MMESTLKTHRIGMLDIPLETSSSVFYPTSTSHLLAEAITIPRDASVLDVGCGVGVLAIYAALMGARTVYAVDIMEQACRLAYSNAVLNNVVDRVTVCQGDLFEPLGGRRFDVVIDDVSGIADEVARLSNWFPEPVPTGGIDGADHVMSLLAGVLDHLNPNGVLYLPIASLSNSRKILDAAKVMFGKKIELAQEVHYPFSPELRDNIATMEGLRDSNVIDFSTRRSRHFWTLSVYRAWI